MLHTSLFGNRNLDQLPCALRFGLLQGSGIRAYVRKRSLGFRVQGLGGAKKKAIMWSEVFVFALLVYRMSAMLPFVVELSFGGTSAGRKHLDYLSVQRCRVLMDVMYFFRFFVITGLSDLGRSQILLRTLCVAGARPIFRWQWPMNGSRKSFA